MRGLWLALLLVVPIAPAVAATPSLTASGPASADPAVALAGPPLVTVRAADHTGFGRVVFDVPSGLPSHTVMEGSRILLVFGSEVRLGPLPALPRNVVSMQADGRTATLTLAPGAQALPLRLGNRLVFDVADPAPRDGRTRSPAADPPAKPALADKQAPKPGRPAPDASPQPVGQETLAAPAPPPAPPAPVTPPAHPAPGLSPAQPSSEAAAQPARDEAAASPAGAPPQPAAAPSLPSASLPPPPPAQPTLRGVLRADATVAAAAFRRAGWGLVVLDRRLVAGPPASLPGATLTAGETATTLQVPLPAGSGLALERVAEGWAVSIVDDPPAGRAAPVAIPDGAAFPWTRPGRAVTVVDPATGSALLVGTSLAAGPQQSMGGERRTPAYAILPTWLGVAVLPRSDGADLRAGPDGFILRGGGLPAGPASLAQAGRHLDLPNEPEPALLNRLHAQLASAAAALPRARTPARVEAAQAMLALGLGTEAQALTQAVLADDPGASADARLAMVGGVAAVMAGRLDEAASLDNPALADDPEAALWRGVRDRRLGLDTEAAQRLPASASLAWSYPPTLRRAIWPAVAEAAAESGVPLPQAQLTPFAASLALEHGGKTAEAIAALQAVAAGPDRFDATRAAVRAAELKLAAGQIDSAQAANEMERQSVAWRGDGREFRLRMRAAELRSAAGGWRAALDLLRATEAIFPEQHDAILQRKTAVFEAMLAANGADMAPLDLVVTAAAYADCLPPDDAGGKLASLLADKLMALDLPSRAIPVLQGLVQTTVAGPARAEFGARLAQLLLDANDPSGAAAALQVSDAPGLSPGQTEARALSKARIQAAQGDLAGAAASLQTIGSTAADDLRASLLGQSGDWRGSAEALSALAAKSVPEQGPLSPAAQAIIVREASAAARLGDAQALAALDHYIPRMAGAQADMVRVLIETPITSIRELPRAASELTAARTIPVHLQSLPKR